MKEYDVFVPLYYNDGTPNLKKEFQQVEFLIIEREIGLLYEAGLLAAD